MRQVPNARQGSTFHQFFYGSNYNQSNPVLKPRFSYEVPTSFLRSLVMQEFRQLKVAAQMRLAENSQDRQTVSQSWLGIHRVVLPFRIPNQMC